MRELGRRFDRADPEAVVVFTPHNVHVEGSLAVITAGRVEGSLASWKPGTEHVRLSLPTDLELAGNVLAKLRAAGLPALAVSFGDNDAPTSMMPMDWATLIPMWYLGGRRESPVPTVVVAPARELDASAHEAAGRAVASACERAGPVAVIASADHGHGHREDGPYGYSAASAPFDERIVEIVRSGRLSELLDIDRDFVEAAKADSWWQLLMLHGVLGDGAWRADLISYEAPTYFGMLCACFEPT